MRIAIPVMHARIITHAIQFLWNKTVEYGLPHSSTSLERPVALALHCIIFFWIVRYLRATTIGTAWHERNHPTSPGPCSAPLLGRKNQLGLFLIGHFSDDTQGHDFTISWSLYFALLGIASVWLQPLCTLTAPGLSVVMDQISWGMQSQQALLFCAHTAGT